MKGVLFFKKKKRRRRDNYNVRWSSLLEEKKCIIYMPHVIRRYARH